MRLLLHGPRRASALETWIKHHQYRVCYRVAGSGPTDGLLGHQGCHPCVHDVAGRKSCRQGNPGECGPARPRLDSIESCRSAARAIGRVWKEHQTWTPGSAGGAIARLRFPGLSGVLQLYHGHSTAGNRKSRLEAAAPPKLQPASVRQDLGQELLGTLGPALRVSKKLFLGAVFHYGPLV